MNNCIGIITSTTTSAGKPMTARCFNDAICYNNDSSHCGSVSKEVEILYWGSGWSGFSPANTSVLQKNDYTNLLNNNGAWYYVLKADNESIQKPSESSGYSSFNVQSFPDGNTVTNPVGAVFCIWCDNYDRLTLQGVKERLRGQLTSEPLSFI